MAQESGKIGEGIDTAEPAGGNEAHEEVAQPCSSKQDRVERRPGFLPNHFRKTEASNPLHSLSSANQWGFPPWVTFLLTLSHGPIAGT
jgi:hypothetical protein